MSADGGSACSCLALQPHVSRAGLWRASCGRASRRRTAASLMCDSVRLRTATDAISHQLVFSIVRPCMLERSSRGGDDRLCVKASWSNRPSASATCRHIGGRAPRRGRPRGTGSQRTNNNLSRRGRSEALEPSWLERRALMVAKPCVAIVVFGTVD